MLHQLAIQELPAQVAGGENVDAVRILALAGLIKATIPSPVRTLHGHEQPPATVSEITRLGQQMLRKFPRR